MVTAGYRITCPLRDVKRSLILQINVFPLRNEAFEGEGIAFGTNDAITARIEEIKNGPAQKLWQSFAQLWQSFAAGSQHGAARWDGIQAWCVSSSKGVIRKSIHFAIPDESQYGFDIDNTNFTARTA